MKYFEVKFAITPPSQDASDILSAMLAEVGFEAFEPTLEGLTAWVQQAFFSQEAISSVLEAFPMPGMDISYVVEEAPDENWNQQWEEEGFRPIIITDDSADMPLIAIHDVSHTDIPSACYDISIHPRQAFGTGSHETTRMILRQLLSLPIKGSRVIDAGTGTGILAIMCKMLGASHVLAYDIDEWSVDNAKDNLLLNHISEGVEVLLGDSSVLNGCNAPHQQASLLIANINRNILLGDMPVFAQSIEAGGLLLLSGFYVDDVPMLLDSAMAHGFTLSHQQEDGDWALLLLKKGNS